MQKKRPRPLDEVAGRNATDQSDIQPGKRRKSARLRGIVSMSGATFEGWLAALYSNCTLLYTGILLTISWLSS